MTAVEVCPVCDIAGCRHIRERKAQMTHPTDEELDAMVRDMNNKFISLTSRGKEDEARSVGAFLDAIAALRAQLADEHRFRERIIAEASDAIEAIGKRCDAANARADRAEAALAAQIEAGVGTVVRLSIARKIGMYGSAYDGPFDARAYTYDHQPGNQAAWAIGRAASNATKDKVGDYIDRGLGLLRHLKAEGFGVFALNDNDTHDRTALSRLLADAEAKALRRAAECDGGCMEGHECPDGPHGVCCGNYGIDATAILAMIPNEGA